MAKERRIIEIEFPDKSFHKVILLGADITRYGEIVLTYYVLDNNMRTGCSEIIKDKDKYYIKPDTQDWNYYGCRLKSRDNDISDSLINSLPKRLELFVKEEEKKTRKKKSSVIEKPNVVSLINEKTIKPKLLTAIMYANRGESLMVRDEFTSLPPIFFSVPVLSDEGDLFEEYRKMNIGEDREELERRIINSFDDIIDISSIPEDQVFVLSSGNKYHINFSSCDDEELFGKLASCDKIRVNVTNSISKVLYYDNLSCALHHELPLELASDNTIIKYDTNSSVGRKQVG